MLPSFIAQGIMLCILCRCSTATQLFSGLPPVDICQLQCKVRHGPDFYNCSLTMEHGEEGHENIAVVQLSEDDLGLAAGQFAAFYQGRRCIGSGVILESWDDQGFPVCEKALEIARMEDKSKLGKPVKIKVKPETPKESGCNKGNESNRNLYNAQNGLEEKRNTSQGEAIHRFPMNWLRKVRE